MARLFQRNQSPSDEYIRSIEDINKLKRRGAFHTLGDLAPSFTAQSKARNASGLEGGEQDFSITRPPLTIPEPVPMDNEVQSPSVLGEDTGMQVNSGDFLAALEGSIQRASQPQFIASLTDGGKLRSDGLIVYEDGTERWGDPSAYGISSQVDGSIMYSDGSTRRSQSGILQDLGNGKALYTDGTIRYTRPAPSTFEGDVETALFGSSGIPITQQYGNVNIGMGYKNNTHGGTDFAVSAKPIQLPFEVRVVQRLYDDGQRFGQHGGYGNSLLVQLPNGEMFRLSHLASTKWGQGDIIPAGEQLGITGSTGNSTGAHLDLEYFDANGQRQDPMTFSGFSDPASVGIDVKQAGTIVPPDQYDETDTQAVSQYQQYSGLNYSPKEGYPRPWQNTPDFAKPSNVLGAQDTQPAQPQQQNPTTTSLQNMGTRLEQMAPQGAPELGLSEALGSGDPSQVYQAFQPKEIARQAVGAGLETVGRQYGLPEAGASELARGNYQEGGTELADFLAKTAGSLGLKTDFQLNETVRKLLQPDSVAYAADDLTNKTQYGGLPTQPSVAQAVMHGAPSSLQDMQRKQSVGQPAEIGANSMGTSITPQPQLTAPDMNGIASSVNGGTIYQPGTQRPTSLSNPVFSTQAAKKSSSSKSSNSSSKSSNTSSKESAKASTPVFSAPNKPTAAKSIPMSSSSNANAANYKPPVSKAPQASAPQAAPKQTLIQKTKSIIKGLFSKR